MADLKDVINYIYNTYPHKDKLSKARLVRMLYLADWRSAIVRRRQLTNLKWKLGENGPEPEEFDQEIRLPRKNRINVLNDFS